jgi:hypothetical protein
MLDYSKNTVLSIRIFHVLLAVILLAAAYQHFQGKKLPESFFYLIAVLGVGAFGYHSYKALQLLGYVT